MLRPLTPTRPEGGPADSADSASSHKAGAQGAQVTPECRVAARGGDRDVSNRTRGILGAAQWGELPLPVGVAHGVRDQPQNPRIPDCPEPAAVGFPICQEFN